MSLSTRIGRMELERVQLGNTLVVKGWVWHNALSGRTCASCWAMHGSTHPLSERLDDRVNGRCAMVPATRTWAELGFSGVPKTRVEVEKGTDMFARLLIGKQREGASA